VITDIPFTTALGNGVASVEVAVSGNIRAAMGRRQVSMSELARRTGLPRSTVKHQLDSDTLTSENLLLIAQALDVDAAVLLAPVTPVTP
jgi:lambda repressor-like predicted transcriptional regulator